MYLVGHGRHVYITYTYEHIPYNLFLLVYCIDKGMAFNNRNLHGAAVPVFIFLILVSLASPSLAGSETDTPAHCAMTKEEGKCHDKGESLKLKLIAIITILVASMIGVCLPMFSRSIPALRPDRNLFVLVKAFSSGVILATGYMHVLPDSFDCLTSECLPEDPWRKFPFTTFVAMLSAVATMMVDSFSMSLYKRHCSRSVVTERLENGNTSEHGQHHLKPHDETESQLLRHRVVAQV